VEDIHHPQRVGKRGGDGDERRRARRDRGSAKILWAVPEPGSCGGLALSGGGIRSAVFSLGVLIALARRDLLPQFDYLSTVSGGGYLGSFLTTFLATPPDPDAPRDREQREQLPRDESDETVGDAAARDAQPADQPANDRPSAIGLKPSQLPFRREEGEAEALRYIRHRSKYLQTSPWERAKFAVAQAYGMMLNAIALLIIPAVLALIEHFLRPLDKDIALRLGVILVIALVSAGVVVPLVVRLHGYRWGDRVYSVLAVLAVGLAAVLAWYVLGFLHTWFAHWGVDRQIAILALFGGIPALASAGSALFGGAYPRAQVALAIVAGLSAPLFLLGTELAIFQWLHDNSASWVILLAAIVLFAAILWFALDVNFTAPHRHYRRKLAETFLIQPARAPSPGRPFDANVPLLLSDAAASRRGPYHLINCALNVPASTNPAMQGRLTDLFLFSPSHSGSALVGYSPTGDWETVNPDLNVATAMAVSGAAASPLMGLGTARYLAFWMTLLNARLGYWVRKPSPPPGRFGDAPGLPFLLREMFGRVDEKARYLNLTDGGHIENLGVYELLRRRCQFILAIDGEHDPTMTFHALTNLQRLAAIDLGVTIDLDLNDLRLGQQGLSRSHFEFCRIRYPQEPGETQAIGYLLYLKLSLTGNEGEFIRRYRYDEPVFPHHSTANQFFTEVQYEAYRTLGEHVGDKLFLRAIVGAMAGPGRVDLEQWFTAIGANMLTPAAAKPAGRN